MNKLYKIMNRTIFNLTFISTLLIFTSSLACGTCGCRANKKNAHSHNEKSIKKDVLAAKSNVIWKASKIGGEHEGNIFLKEGHLHFEDDKLVSGKIEIDMNTISCTDLSGTYKNKLETHLNSPDFFDTKKFPVSSIELIKCQEIGNKEYKINAEITIKDITKEIQFTAELLDGTASANIILDRSEFDVRYGSGTFFSDLGDNLIYDDFELNIRMFY